MARSAGVKSVKDPSVLLHAMTDGINLLTWAQEGFAFAEGYDAEAGRYEGLRAGQIVTLVDSEAPEVLVKTDVAMRQMDAERPVAPEPEPGRAQPNPNVVGDKPTVDPPEITPPREKTPPPAAKPKRFHGTVLLDATRVGRDAGRIAEEVIAHLDGLVHAKVTVTIEIEAKLPDGAPDQVVRTVSENCRTLKFTSQGFEKD
ncbi:hypothetical protein [Thiocapsa bogorovii]|uniref:hypothetical protein n=1 Tax=Thiocapsa bogorovii TaxID=521689 RepID=UPI001E3A8FD9|nr:hypothetical protein [Thiocapsa bogorovii]UHD18377.1 hypothetical protein LT988_10230 [Thiocapsa bogorovii]